MSKHKPHVEDLEFESEEETAPTDKIKSLRQQLLAAQTEAKEYLDGWQRARADYANLQKSAAGDKLRLGKQAKQTLLLDLINLADTFELARSDETALAAVPPAWRQGFEHIHKDLLAILNRHGLTVIDPLGETFDPKQHEPLGTAPTTDPSQDHQIVKVLKKGYALEDEIIRPAQVTVATLSN